MGLINLIKKGFQQTAKGIEIVDNQLVKVEQKCLGGLSIDERMAAAYQKLTAKSKQEEKLLKQLEDVRKQQKKLVKVKKAEEKQTLKVTKAAAKVEAAMINMAKATGEYKEPKKEKKAGK